TSRPSISWKASRPPVAAAARSSPTRAAVSLSAIQPTKPASSAATTAMASSRRRRLMSEGITDGKMHAPALDRLAVGEIEVQGPDRGAPAHADTVTGHRLEVVRRIGGVADVVEHGRRDRLAHRMLVLEAGDTEVAPADRRPRLLHAECLV